MDIRDIAYEMVKAYKLKRTQGEAVEKVKDAYPDSDLSILWAMWYAIDAYVDINDKSDLYEEEDE